MKASLAILLIVLVLGFSSRNTSIIIGFKLNQAEIIGAKCENKGKPAVKCNGKCYLKKQVELTTNDGKNQKIPISLVEQIEETIYYLPFDNLSGLDITTTSIKNDLNTYYQFFIPQSFTKSLLRPPQTIV